MAAPKSAGLAAGERARFEATLFMPDPGETIGSGTLLTLPKEVSANLPSRGMILVKGAINGAPFQAVLEPDGKGSHWFKVSDAIRAAANADVGDTVTLEIEPAKDWPEPRVPNDLAQALAADPSAQALWLAITPLARWDWIRWIGATRNPQTRQRRVDVAIDKLTNGKRRPCCFDRNQCTLTDA
ncbi:MAG TPA: YdeI/OmpD-associated family protein [Chloroflexota bacterium]|nr:YdeI/OmpD-associated family protein [Chloroflexota bacterium]